MQKNQIAVILTAVGALILFSNWGHVADHTEARLRNEPPRPRKVVYWTSSGSPEADYLEANLFMREHPDILVQPNFRETGGLQDILFLSFLSGNPPDYMNAREHEIRNYALFGGVRPLDDLLAREGPEYFDAFLEGEARVYRFNANPDDRVFARDEQGRFLQPLDAARLLSLSGRAVGLRDTSTPDTLTYNKRIFREAARMFPDAGLVDAYGEPVPPRTWMELYETARVISEYGRQVAEQRGDSLPATYGLVLQGQRSNDLMRGIRPLARRAGSMAFNFKGDEERVQRHFDLATPEGRRAAARHGSQPLGYFEYDHPAQLAAFSLIYRMRRENLVLPGMEARHYEDVRTALATGQAAMLIDGWHAALIGTERVPWASADIGSAPIPVPYVGEDPEQGVTAEDARRERERIESLLELDALGLTLPPGNKLPRSTGNQIEFMTSLARDPEAAWKWMHFGVFNEDIVRVGTRRGAIRMVRVAMDNLDNRDWFPFAYQPQIYDIIENHSEMWPSPPQHGPVNVPSELDVFYRHFYQQTDKSLAEVLSEAREELARFSDAANADLARRIQDGLTRPEVWTFPDFNPSKAETFFARQENIAEDPVVREQLDALRAALAAQAAADPRLRDLVTEDGRDLRDDLWKFSPAGSPWLILWIPGLLLLMVSLWLVANAIRNQRNRREWWQATRLEARSGWHGYVFVLPGMLLLFTFAIYPSLYQFVIATQRGDGLGAMQNVGFDNFARILNPAHPHFDRVFWTRVLPNTLLFMVGVTAGQVCVGLLIASMLNLPLKSNSVYRVLFFIPLVTSLAIVSVIFTGLLQGEDSGVNQMLLHFGLENLPHRLGLASEPGELVNWLGERFGLATVMMVSIWHGLPYNIILLLAGLQSISPDLYEAAKVDGASPWQRFRHVTFPEILPILIIITFQAFVGAAKAFSVVFVLTEGGVNHSSELVATYIFKWGFMRPEGREADLGYASALGIVYSLMLAALTLANVMIIARRWKKRLEMENAPRKEAAA